MKLCEVQLMQPLKPIDHPYRLQFANRAKDRLKEGDEFQRELFFQKEIHVNKSNCHI